MRTAPLDRDRGRVVVVGGGIAAVSLCGALRAGGFAGPLTVLEAGGAPHDRPPLSKAYLGGGLAEDAVLLRPAGWWAEHRVELRTGVRATGVERTADGTLTVLAGRADADRPPGRSGLLRLPADRVVLATGGAAAAPPLPGVEHAHTLRDRADADRLRGRFGPGHRVVVVGAGLIGSEVASTALGLGCQVSLVDPATPLWDLLGPELAVWLHLLHRERGITMVADAVLRIEPDGVHVPGAVLPADTVVLATGLIPWVPVDHVDGPRGREELDRSADGAIRVGMSGATSVPGVLAVGDVSARPGAAGSAGHWEAARLDGEDVARVLLGEDPVSRGASWFWSDRHGHHLEVLGSMADADVVVTRGTRGEPPFSCFGLSDGTVVAAAAVDDPAAVKVARRLVQRRIPVDPAAVADPATDLRRIARGR